MKKIKNIIFEIDSQNNINIETKNDNLDLNISKKEAEIENVDISNLNEINEIRDFYIQQQQLELKKIKDIELKDKNKEIELKEKERLEQNEKLKNEYESMKKNKFYFR